MYKHKVDFDLRKLSEWKTKNSGKYWHFTSQQHSGRKKFTAPGADMLNLKCTEGLLEKLAPGFFIVWYTLSCVG